MAFPTRRVLALTSGLTVLALGAGCSQSNSVISYKQQPSTLVATDRLGGAMFDDRPALAAAVRAHRNDEIRMASVTAPR